MNPVWVDAQANEHEMDEDAEDNEHTHNVGEQMDGQTAGASATNGKRTTRSQFDTCTILQLVPSLCNGALKRESISATDTVQKKDKTTILHFLGVMVTARC